MENSVSTLIKKYLTTGKDEYFEQLLERFSPLIKSYARKLYYLDYEDSFQELSIALYEAITKITFTDNEYACISYIKKSIINKFTKLYRESIMNQTIQANSMSLENPGCHNLQDHSETDDSITYIDLKRLLKNKSQIEQTIFIGLILGYSDRELANLLGYTRQYVNRIKKHIWKPDSFK